MTQAHDHLKSVLKDSREDLVQRSTDIAFAAGAIDLPRSDVEQMLRACVAILDEALEGRSTDIRNGFLAALPDVARTTTWDSTMRGGLACWGVLIGQLVARSSKAYQDEATTFLSRFMGDWWADVSKAMLPVHIAENKL